MDQAKVAKQMTAFVAIFKEKITFLFCYVQDLQ